MKHLPNLLTLGNLFCGCIAIAYILTAQPYTSMSLENGGMPTWKWIYGAEQMYFGSIFIFIAGICDLLDGMVARALGVHSPIGKDLDSLADVVSFGVAPSMILFKLLWDALMGEKNAMDVSMLGMAPAFLVACFAALRLARFNIAPTTKLGYFNGIPTPAVGLFVGAFPIIMWYNPYNIAKYFQNKWTLYLLIAILCWLMVSKIKFIKLMPSKWSIGNVWPQLIVIAGTVVAAFFVNVAAIIVAFVLYVLVSLVYNLSPALSKGEGEVE